MGAHETNRAKRVEALLGRAVLILGALACRGPRAPLGNAQVIAMKQELWFVLEELNDMKVKVDAAS